eukprot:COSAG06_NODE_63245_length_263_cov_0.097561_1_plen_44_part_10
MGVVGGWFFAFLLFFCPGVFRTIFIKKKKNKKKRGGGGGGGGGG